MKNLLLIMLAFVLCLGGCATDKSATTEPATTENIPTENVATEPTETVADSGTNVGEDTPDAKNISCEELMWAAVNAVHFSEDGSLDGSDVYSPANGNFDALEMALWADSSFEDCPEYELLTDYAVLYLPYAYVTYEVAVFKADSAENAEKLLDVLERRIKTMSAGDKGFYDANFEKTIDDAQVYREGNYAFMLITGDAATSRAAVEELMQ